MTNRYASAILALLIGFVLGACRDTRTPLALDPVDDPPAFQVSHGDFNCSTANPAPVGGEFDNIVVPPGQRCNVTGATVRGNITALQDAELFVDGTQVGRDIYGDKADVVHVLNSTVQGDIRVADGGPHPIEFETQICVVHLPQGSIKVIRMTGYIFIGLNCGPNTVGKDIQVNDNIIPSGAGVNLGVFGNTIAKRLEVNNNRGPGSKLVSNNTARSVRCFENEAPFVGASNTADKMEGDCS